MTRKSKKLFNQPGFLGSTESVLLKFSESKEDPRFLLLAEASAVRFAEPDTWPKNNLGELIYLNKNQLDKKKLILPRFENLGCMFISVNNVPSEHGAFINFSQ